MHAMLRAEMVGGSLVVDMPRSGRGVDGHAADGIGCHGNLFLREIFEDRALGAVVAVAMPRKVLERADHGVELRDLLPELLEMLSGYALHGGARARFVLP